MQPGLPDWVTRRLDVDRDTGCWRWTGGRTSTGYGVVWVQRDGYPDWADEPPTQRVHRIVWKMLRGGPAGHLVKRDVCDDRACCNPEHWEVVSKREHARRAGRTKTRPTGGET
jgi:hypothetical protein